MPGPTRARDEKDEAQEKLASECNKIGVYRHYKGPLYTVFAFSVKEETCVPQVSYYSHDHMTRWTRDLSYFFGTVEGHGKRFEFKRVALSDELLLAVGLQMSINIVANR